MALAQTGYKPAKQALDGNKTPQCAFIDFQNAFDTHS